MHDPSAPTPGSRDSIEAFREDLKRREIDQCDFSDSDAVYLACAVNGLKVLPEPEGDAHITAVVWLAAALAADGRYKAPAIDGHLADLGDGGPLVDSAILMLIVQRHFLTTSAPGWSNTELAREFDLHPDAFARAQIVLQRAIELIPPTGPGPQAMRPWFFRAYLRIMGAEHLLRPQL